MIRNLNNRKYVKFNENLRGFEMIIPSANNWFVVGFLIIWLSAWFLGERFAIKSLLEMVEPQDINSINRMEIPAAIFLVIWVLAWTIGGLFVSIQILWFVAGKEVITISSGRFIINKKILIFGKKKIYDSNLVKNLGLKTYSWNSEITKISDQAKNLKPTSVGGLRFLYKNKTVRFASGVSELEAKKILEIIHKRFPELK